MSRPNYVTLTVLSILLTSLVGTASASAPKDGFTCEKIKDKPMRTSCIEARDSKADANKAAKEQEAARLKKESGEKAQQEQLAKIEAEGLETTCQLLGDYIQQTVADLQTGSPTTRRIILEDVVPKQKGQLRNASNFAIMNWNIGTPREVKADSIVQCKAHKFD